MLAKLETILTQRGGRIVSGEYRNTRTRLRFGCTQGHEWEAKPGSILKGSWCKQCWQELEAGKHLQLKDGLEQALKIAAERSGECLSNTYEAANKPLHWRCQNGHEWFAALSDIKKLTWCPHCNLGVRERACRTYLEALTGHAFPKSRPTWLTNSRGNRMELDGYCKELNIAFEHHGAQHYKEVPHFHRRNEKLVYRKEDDARKRELCTKRDISLIEVPYTVPASDLLRWLHHELSKHLDVEQLKDYSNLDFNLFHPAEELAELQRIAVEHGGECLSLVYLGTLGKHAFRCAKGHEWEAVASHIKSYRRGKGGTWCPICKPERIGASNRKHSVESMRKLAESKDGKFLSPTFRSVNERYPWQCSEGHEWETAPTDIMKGTWCRICSIQARRHTLEDLQEVARSRGGECLATEYLGAQRKHRWRCVYGHEWEARFDNIRNSGAWCPICARSQRGKRKFSQDV
jgi:hypothetical protein